MSDSDEELKIASKLSVRKNKRGQPIRSEKRLMVVNVYKAKKLANPRIKYDQLVQELAAECGFGKTSIQKIISDYNNNKTISSPTMKKNRKKIIEEIDDFTKNAVREKVHSFRRKHEFPTLQKIIQAVNEDERLPTLKRTTMYHLLKELNLV